MLFALLAAGGAISRVLEGFEQRGEQQRMIEAVVETFELGRVLLVEARTGKSLALGLPALWAQRSCEQVVLIGISSTFWEG